MAKVGMDTVSTVFFKSVKSCPQTSAISEAGEQLLNHLLEAERLELKPTVPLKVHFGEKGNETFIRAENYMGIIKFLESKNVRSAFIETNVLYRGERQNRTSHMKLAVDHGFTQLPLIIADGEYGDEFAEVKGKGRHFNSYLIAKGIADSDQLIILSHFKGHILSGFGGAVKQLAMGCASRGGKLAQHAHAAPKIKPRKCVGCEECLEMCPAEAIILEPKLRIDENRCVGCASCIAVCKEGAMTFSWWGSISKKFRERMAEYAWAAQKGKENIYINFVLDVTRNCDCQSKKMKPIVSDIGVLASIDPVALDSACLDLVQKGKGRKIFERGRPTLEYAQEIGLGTMTYQLLEV